jgi:signal transduction histidine kinase
VNVDPEQLKRVVVNLVDNAAEAMRDSMVKRLLVATRGTPGDSPDTVEVLVADTGRGVSAEDKERLFLPYFSTKERGTGLGLAIVSHIVGEHGGRIRVEDNRPAGARFYVEIPLTGDAVAPETEIVGSGVRV